MHKIICSGVLALALGASVGVPAALAKRISEIEYIYFSDATYTVEVGYRVRDCAGHWHMDGTRTDYFTVSTTPC